MLSDSLFTVGSIKSMVKLGVWTEGREMVEKSNLGLSDPGEFHNNNPHYHGEELQYPDHHIRRTMPVLNNGEIPSFCAGCGARILDRHYLLAVDRQWHMQCLKCCECKIRLDTELTCFARDGNIYCKEDYYRFAVKRCARCQLGISANELVMRARDWVYHITCFTCMACNKTLTTGDQFGMKENLVYCRTDYELLFQGEFFHGMTPGLPCSSGGHFPYYNGVGTVQKGRPRKRKNPIADGEGCPPGMGLVPGDGHERGGDMMRQDGYGTHPPPRQKRVRTSFKHHQLRTMKSYFGLNHNPDAKDLKQLAQKTGLSKRVLQVWFQNARAKYRRNVLKQDDKPGGGGSQGGSQAGDSPEDEKSKENQSLSEMTDSGSPAMSDISSSPSLSELHSSHMESDHSSSSLSDLFTNSINSIS
ncbi:LIM/homeobox protein Lhx9-like isoform X2 [Ylistrum balloti]|uniref:LIM/homeobox protein Lhx9-like isoform X2 n=1 Tax=Ylistrum balloti TaxID=509963 RepID=UPI0029058AC0|nr:LIM/homeobox protein Lhx9-like isoform X2 [Ylistrum balloti]